MASVSAVGQPSPEEAAAKAAEAAAEKARYEALKVEFQGWTLGFGLVGGLAAYYLYGSDVAISYALGASSGLQYLRLLTRSVDAGEGARDRKHRGLMFCLAMRCQQPVCSGCVAVCTRRGCTGCEPCLRWISCHTTHLA